MILGFAIISGQLSTLSMASFEEFVACLFGLVLWAEELWVLPVSLLDLSYHLRTNYLPSSVWPYLQGL